MKTTKLDLTKEELETIADALINKMQIYNNLKSNLPSVRLLGEVNKEIENIEKIHNLICATLEQL
jgi:hypothetical protein